MNEQMQLRPDSAPFPPPQLAAPATLYVSGGVPTLFMRLENNASVDSDPWLYLPDRVQEDIVAALPQSQRFLPTIAASIDVDDNTILYPLVVGGHVRGAAVIPSGGPHMDDGGRQLVLEWLLRRELAHYQSAEHDCLSPIATLITCEASSAQFLRNALSLLCEQVPSGLAATYDENDGLYRLRTAVGNIASWDVLPGELPHSTASRWVESIASGRHFLPGGFLPERPMTLQSAPVFLFVHRGIQSDVVQSLVAVPVPGDLPRRSAERLIAIAQTIARLHSNCLGLSEDLGRICGTVRTAFEARWNLGEMLAEIFRIIRHRIGLSRLVVIPESGPTHVVLQCLHTDPVVRMDTAPAVASGFIERTSAGHFFSPDVASSGLLTEQEAKRYYLDNVKSEFCIRLASVSGRTAVVAFGLPDTGAALKQVGQLLDTAGTAIYLYDRLVAGRDGEWRQHPLDQEKLLCRRLEMLNQLVGGYLHCMRDTIATLGSRDARDDDQTESQVVPKSRGSLETLRALMDCTQRLFEYAGHGEPLTVACLFRDLPAFFEGLVHNIQDTKNIAVRVIPEASGAGSARWNSAALSSSLFPVIAAVMQEAICSGEIHVRETRVQGRPALQIECLDSLIAHTTLRDILLGWAQAPAEHGNGAEECRIDCGSCYWLCDEGGNGMQAAALVSTQPYPDVCSTTQTLSVPEDR